MQLGMDHYITGNLSKVKYENSQIKLVLSLKKEIEILPTTIPLNRLSSLKGKKVGVFNVDGEFFCP